MYLLILEFEEGVIMKILRYIKSSNYCGYDFRYEVHWMTPSGQDKLLGGSHTLEGAQEIAFNQAQRIFESPWEDDNRKFLFLQNLYMYDSETQQECTTYDVEDYVDRLMSEIDSRKRTHI